MTQIFILCSALFIAFLIGFLILRRPVRINPSSNINPKLELVDKGKAECPACHHKLKKIPGSKTKCLQCGQFMFVRTRPKTNERVLVTKNEAEEIDEEWSILNGVHDNYLENKKFELMTNDEKWHIFNDQLLQHWKHQDWGLYRNVRLDMAEMVAKEKKLKDALYAYLEVCYIDLNGATNSNAEKNSEILKKYPPFDPTIGFLADGVIAGLREVIENLNITKDEVEAIFIEHNLKIKKSLKTPLSPGKCWLLLEKELRK